MDINKLLDAAVQQGASDLHLAVGRPPVLRISGRLRAINTPPLTGEDTEALLKQIIPDRAATELEEGGSADFGLEFSKKGRFRVAAFRQRGELGVVLRLIPNQLLTFEQIGLPPNIKEFLARPRGLILITGPTGSGKSTTLATMVDYINQNFDRHIITIEDPIEFYHQHKKSIITQREVGPGRDVPNFAEGVRRALRQDPDVILVGEMRDLETISAGIAAAETGHLVFGTLHTTGAPRTITRVVDAYPTNQQPQVRAQLSVALSMVISQALIPTIDGTGRIAAFEIMLTTSGIASLIRENKIAQISSDITTGRKEGMKLMDDNLLELVVAGRILPEEAVAKAVRPDSLAERIEKEIEKLREGRAVRGQ